MPGRGLILAAPASGSGKTLVAAGLLRALRQRGIGVAAAKAGPDYIDPTFHALASGAECLNLDPWAMRPETLAGLVRRLEEAAEIIVCEGVMGLFDGTGADGETGSTAELARVTGWPVVLVVDARRQGASVAALVAGFAGHDPAVRLAGLVLNRVASPRHRALLEAALCRHVPQVPFLGALPYDASLALPERHLGLVPAGETAAEAIIARAASAISAGADIDAVLRIARQSRTACVSLTTGECPTLQPFGRHMAVARDDGFVFTYPAILDLWRAAGAELSFFSPLGDEAPDPAADAVYLPGGYPELHAGRLAAAATFLTGLRDAAGRGAAIYGECGGYMVLGESLIDAAGIAHRMAGLLPLATSFAERRLHLGYRAARLVDDGPLGPAGAGFRGHEFHYATTVRTGDAAPLFEVTDAAGEPLAAAGLRRGMVCGSFLHLIDGAT